MRAMGRGRAPIAALVALLLLAASARPSVGRCDEDEPGRTRSLLPHAADSPLWLSGQANFILQAHPRFHSPYEGPNSLPGAPDHALSRVFTIYAAFDLGETTELVVDGESAGGGGIGEALGLGGVTNVDVVRNPTLGSSPYLARAWVRQIVPLSAVEVDADRSPTARLARVPEERLEIRVGKFSIVDFFDQNAVGSDSHLQFMNWTVVNDGAYDYAADTRGYTYGAVIEHVTPARTIRFGEALMPKVANGTHLDADLSRARSENLEVEIHGEPWSQHASVLRLLGFVNHADLGSYSEAIHAFLAKRDRVPDVSAHRRQRRVKYGFGANIEQALGRDVRGFVRLGWNEGRHESFAYTEVNATGAIGADVAGRAWSRGDDKLGIAFVVNGLSRLHRQYLALGGQGFLLGDGRLRYGTERIVETYYTLAIGHGVFPAIDLQYVSHPGYNRDRGPVLVPGMRLHVEF